MSTRAGSRAAPLRLVGARAARLDPFPSWAPADVIGLWRETARALEERERSLRARGVTLAGFAPQNHGERSDHQAARRMHNAQLEQLAAERRATVDMLERLLREERMHAVWAWLSKAGAAERAGNVPHTALFAAMVLRATMEPIGEENWTAAERARQLEQIAHLAAELAAAIAGTGIDDILWRQYLAAKAAAGVPPGAVFDWQPGQLSTLLRSLAGKVVDPFANPIDPKKTTWSAALYLHRARLPRQRSPRAYFVRYLAAYLREAFGSAPTAMLTATVGVVLQDERVGERQIRRLLSGRGSGR